jgi:hypothetical protein
MPVSHAFNPSILGHRDQEAVDQHQSRKLVNVILFQKYPTKNRAAGVA